MKYKHISAYRVLDKSLNNRLKEVDSGILQLPTLKLYGRLMIIFSLLGRYGANLIVGLFLRYYNSGVDLSFVITPDDNRIIRNYPENKMAAYDILVEIKEDGLRLFSVGAVSFIDEKISLVVK
jgi:hypothetical protein